MHHIKQCSTQINDKPVIALQDTQNIGLLVIGVNSGLINYWPSCLATQYR